MIELSTLQVTLIVFVSFALGFSFCLAFLFLAKLSQADHDTPGETVDDILSAAGRDLPTQRLPQPGTGTVYSGGHRRSRTGGRVARVGRANRWRHRATPRRLP